MTSWELQVLKDPQRGDKKSLGKESGQERGVGWEAWSDVSVWCTGEHVAPVDLAKKTVTTVGLLVGKVTCCRS
jgi:hypothetical protein